MTLFKDHLDYMPFTGLSIYKNRNSHSFILDICIHESRSALLSFFKGVLCMIIKDKYRIILGITNILCHTNRINLNIILGLC